MNELEFDIGTYYPILGYLVLLLVFAISVMIVAHTVGPRHDTKGKQVPYESGMDPIGDARQRFDIKFYLIAIMFLVFDVELLFLYPWAAVAYARNAAGEEIGYPAALRLPVFLCVLTFIGLLFIAYLYDWKKGVFKWR